MPHSSCRFNFKARSGAFRFITVTDSPATAKMSSASWRSCDWCSWLVVAIESPVQCGIITETGSAIKVLVFAIACRYFASQVRLLGRMLKKEGMEPDDLLCSRNARPQKALVGRAQ